MSKILLFIIIIAVSIIKAVIENKAKAKRAQQPQSTPSPDGSTCTETMSKNRPTYEPKHDVELPTFDTEYREELPPYEPMMPNIPKEIHIPPVAVREVAVTPKTKTKSDPKQEGSRIDLKPKKKTQAYTTETAETSSILNIEEMRKAVIYNAILNRPNY